MGDGLFADSERFHREVASQRQIRTTPGRLGVRSGSLNRENIMAVISMALKFSLMYLLYKRRLKMR